MSNTRSTPARTHCKRDHELAGANRIEREIDGYLVVGCRACSNLTSSLRHAQQRKAPGMRTCVRCENVKPEIDYADTGRLCKDCAAGDLSYAREQAAGTVPIAVRRNLVAQGLNVCGHCAEVSELENFGIHSRTWHGRRNVCQECHARSSRASQRRGRARQLAGPN